MFLLQRRAFVHQFIALSTILLEVSLEASASEDSHRNKICTSEHAGEIILFLCKLLLVTTWKAISQLTGLHIL